jgi:hypothetical protein
MSCLFHPQQSHPHPHLSPPTSLTELCESRLMGALLEVGPDVVCTLAVLPRPRSSSLKHTPSTLHPSPPPPRLTPRSTTPPKLPPKEGAAEAPALLRLASDLGLAQLRRAAAAYVARHHSLARRCEGYAALSRGEVDLVAGELAAAMDKVRGGVLGRVGLGRLWYRLVRVDKRRAHST